MSTVTLLPQARQRYYGNDGNVLAGGKLYTYVAGTVTPKVTYQDAAGTVPHPNPIILDSKGEAVIYWSGVYKIDLHASDDTQITGWPVDNVQTDSSSLSADIAAVQANLVAFEAALAGSGGSALVGFVQAGAGSVTRTVQDKLREAMVSAKDKGATLDGVADDTTHIRDALNTSNNVNLSNFNCYAPNLTQAEVSDTIFYGNGLLKGVYRKFAIPDTATGPSAPAETILPGRHLNALTKAAPVVVLVGDSISTFQANQTGRTDMLAYLLEQEIKRQIPTAVFYDRSWAGSSLVQFNNVNNPTPPAEVLWWTPANTSWIGQVMALNPDVIVLSFGMNDGNSMQAKSYDNLRTILGTSGFTGDLVLCTNLMPSLRATDVPANATRAQQDGRDNAAGVTRSYAQFNNLGLLDFNRQFVKVRDGYDPVSSALRGSTMTRTVDGTGKQYTGQEEVIDFMAVIDIPAGGLPAGQNIGVRTGPYANDILYMSTNAGNWHFDLYCGDVPNTVTLRSQNGIAFINTGMRIAVEVKQDTITVWDVLTGGTFGQYNVPLFQSRLVRAGGWFLPFASTAVVGSNVDFYPGIQALNRPRLRDKDFFNGSGFAGSGWNHPGNYTGEYIYQPVFNMVHWTEQYTLARQMSLSHTATPPTVSHVLNVRAGSSGHVRLEEPTSGAAWGLDIDGATGNLNLRRIAGTGVVDIGGGVGINMFGKAVSQDAVDTSGAGFRRLRVPN